MILMNQIRGPQRVFTKDVEFHVHRRLVRRAKGNDVALQPSAKNAASRSDSRNSIHLDERERCEVGVDTMPPALAIPKRPQLHRAQFHTRVYPIGIEHLAVYRPHS